MPVEVRGLREMRKDMRGMSAVLGREFDREARGIARIAAAEAASLAPKKTGALAASIRPFSTYKGIGIRTSLVYARVNEYGGHRWLRRGLPYAKPDGAGISEVAGRYGRLPVRQVPAKPGKNGQARVVNEAQYLIKRRNYMRVAALNTSPLLVTKTEQMLDRLAREHSLL